MDNVILLSKLKNNLGNIISDYKNKINEIEEKEKFLQILSDLVNYSKSDVLLFPFYDENILEQILEVVFPVFNSTLNKIKTAKYLIESSKNVDRQHFPQYNNIIKELEQINNDIIKYYENIITTNNYATEKEQYSQTIEKYTTIDALIGEEKFIGLIENIDLFHEIIYQCKLDNNEINKILNIAIENNLNYLNENGILEIEEPINNKEETQKLNELENISL
ncbi:MAG: hypothetical protein J6D28_01355 [Bacilli bacterium]|nr:hypothetical protein [Bacilli bacterium]